MNGIVRFAAMAAVACAAAACSTPVPQALKPQDVPPAFQGPLTPGASIWPNPDWWNNFGSTELSGLVTAAQTDNFDIAVAMADVLQAEANRDIQRAALFPDITGTASATRSRTPTTTFITGFGQSAGSVTLNSFNLGANGTYAADIWGLAQDNLRAAQEALKSSRFAQQEVALTTTASVADSYFAILAIRQEIGIIQQNIDAAERILTITRAKVTNGVSSQLDLSQQEATVYGQEAALPPLREQELEQLHALAILLGRPPEGFNVTGKDLDAVKIPGVSPGLPSELIARRPDIAQAEANLASAHANVDAARAAFFPAITLTGGAGFGSTALNTLFPGGFEWSIGASALQQIFDGGKLIGESDLAKAQQLGLVATYRKTVISAFSGVETSLGQVTNFSDEVDALQKEVAASANAFRISELQYREGIADLLSVLQAQETLFTAQNQLMLVKLQRSQAVVGLYVSLGGGWAENPDDQTQLPPPTAVVVMPVATPAPAPAAGTPPGSAPPAPPASQSPAPPAPTPPAKG
jgi:NodT family efflux transporter outer membrane factor (OMF) lipoprotein